MTGLLLLLLGLAPDRGEAANPKEEKVSASIHQQAAECRENYVPDPCDDVCETCHSSKTAGTTSTVTVDEEFPDLYSATAEEDPWLSLPPEHQACRDCHALYADSEINHPIFIAPETDFFAWEPQNELKLFDGKILCATCHNPHQATSVLLRISNRGSVLCLECHVK